MPDLEHRTVELSEPEREWLRAAEAWINEDPTVTGRALATLTSSSRRLVQRVLDGVGAQKGAEVIARRVIETFDPVTSPVSLSRPATIDNDDARRRQAMRAADGHARAVQRRYIAVLGLQGAATGAASVNPFATVAALTTDVAASTFGLLRAASEILSGYHDFADLKAVSVATLLVAGETDATARRAGLLEAAGVGPDHRRGGHELASVLAEQAGPRIVNEAVEALVRRRIRQRALSTVPLLGAATGAATSVWMAERTCTAARNVGRLASVHDRVGLDPAALNA